MSLTIGMSFIPSINENGSGWRVAMAVDGGSRRRLVSAEAVAGGSWWLAAEPSPKQGRTGGGEQTEQPEWKKGRRRRSWWRRRRPGDPPGWRPNGRVSAAGGSERRETGKRGRRGGFTRQAEAGGKKEGKVLGFNFFWFDSIHLLDLFWLAFRTSFFSCSLDGLALIFIAKFWAI